ncbi:MAG: LLM class flavin-dependent oxidoreductase [Gammaproteobacteria bacterium]|nr:LLM class flavin-dependent oxidoreductase [Gammaproteobacteria bacterium]
MSQSARQMTMVAFMQAQNCSNYIGSWRHPASQSDFLSPKYYQRIARILEDGKFHVAFFDDRLAMPDRYKDDHEAAVEAGARVVKMDLIPLLTAMGMATSKLGLGGTYTTTYYQPFHVARVFATLDHMIGGRAGWNVVTSLNDSEAHNFGMQQHVEHDLRYDMADEFLEVVLGHWDSWEDDALIVDKQGRFADGRKVHRLGYEGRWFKSRGPFTVPRTPQGRPVLIQAGQSGRGRRFAARWGELIFCAYKSVEMGRANYRALKDEAVRFGRDPASLHICPAVYVIVGETREIAEEKRAVADSMAKPIDQLALLSEGLNFDFGSKPMDEPFTEEELNSISGLQALRDRVVEIKGDVRPSVRDFMEITGRGTLAEHPVFCGTPADVADQMEAWFSAPACDGFVLAATSIPGTYEDFVRLVVPELQRRGLYHKDYAGNTLRENLGLTRAERYDWQRP